MRTDINHYWALLIYTYTFDYINT